MGEINDFFFFFISSGAKITRDPDFTGAGFPVQFLLTGTRVAKHQASHMAELRRLGITGCNCYLKKCGRRLHLGVTEINQTAWTQLHRDNFMSVGASEQRRLCGQFDTGIPDILPKLE